MALGVHVAQRGVVQAVLLLDAHVAIAMEACHALALIVGRIPARIREI